MLKIAIAGFAVAGCGGDSPSANRSMEGDASHARDAAPTLGTVDSAVVDASAVVEVGAGPTCDQRLAAAADVTLSSTAPSSTGSGIVDTVTVAGDTRHLGDHRWS